jgi:flagellin
MSLVLNTNIASLVAQNNLTNTSNSLNTSLQALSSGLQLNSASDGPANWVISQEQSAQIGSLQAAIQNTTTAGNLVQTASGALTEVNNLLVQIRSLAVNSANTGTNDASALAANQAQVANALSTIDQIASNTQFGTTKLLNGSVGLTGTVTAPSDVTFLNATDSGATGSYSINVTTAATTAVVDAGTAQTGALASNETLTINGVAVALTAGETQGQVINTINQYTGQTGVAAELGSATVNPTTDLYSTAFGSAGEISVQSDVAASATSSGFGTTVTTAQGNNIAGTIGGYTATGVGDVLTGSAGSGASGISVQVANQTGSDTTSFSSVGSSSVNLGQVDVANNALVFQIGANYEQTTSIGINNVSSAALGQGVSGSQFANLSQINVETESGAQDTIKTVDQALTDVTTLEANLGAFQQQTLQSLSNNLNATLENTTAAQAAITDTDFAATTANYTKEQTLLQAGTTVLANANQVPSLILNLLK